MGNISVVVETTSLESESTPRPERVESESRPSPERVESETRNGRVETETSEG